eukprot:SAG31_NODE_18273_length_641_cov_1.448339_1_plen_68_part_01
MGSCDEIWSRALPLLTPTNSGRLRALQPSQALLHSLVGGTVRHSVALLRRKTRPPGLRSDAIGPRLWV